MPSQGQPSSPMTNPYGAMSSIKSYFDQRRALTSPPIPIASGNPWETQTNYPRGHPPQLTVSTYGGPQQSTYGGPPPYGTNYGMYTNAPRQVIPPPTLPHGYGYAPGYPNLMFPTVPAMTPGSPFGG